ncbi:hypothetical protein [Kitasatospora sp. NPDC058478]|uniref:hypothetical protein n=1 Tax=unclassified Kitasatospora TaxID=2633591 RepID=UPI00365125DE
MKRVIGAVAATAGLALAAALSVGAVASTQADSTWGRSVQSTQADSTWGVNPPNVTPTPSPEVTLADSTWG